MLDRLGEFERSNGRQVGSAAFALGLHVALIFLGIRATNAAAAAAIEVARDTIRLELGRPAEPHRSTISPPDGTFPIPAPPPALSLRPEPPRLDLPRFDSPAPAFDPQALAGLSGTSDSAEAGGSTFGTEEVRSVAEVDEPPQLVGGPSLQYPETLRLTGLAGLVELEYVVTGTGRVEPGSIRVLRGTHDAFAEAAREALAAARFRPARRGGRPVAVLVRQTMRFIVR
jgi:TonB family protein